MQIDKIDNNKLEVILSINDLKDNNIDVHSFLSNSSETQNLFFNILDLAEEKFNFVVDENKFIVESVNLDESLFLITITKLTSNEEKEKNTNNLIIYKITSFDEFYELTKIINKDINLKNIHIYNYNNSYFFVLENFSDINLLYYFNEYGTAENNCNYLKDILFEYGTKIEI